MKQGAQMSYHNNKITTSHLDRLAYVYVRQSTLAQVRENTASTQRQYDLSKRAYSLGWPKELIEIIDEDQGQSGSSSENRLGFQRLVSQVGLGRVGAVIGLEVSRLARRSSDWHRLLEFCTLANCLVIDEEGIYDPNDFNDRLILGMKGNLSEYELHFLKMRMQGGKKRKAEDGKLRVRLPVGYVYDEKAEVVLDPDEQVQQTIQMAFDLFKRLGTGMAVVRYFKKHELLFPKRHTGGTKKGKLTWQPLNERRIVTMLRIPAYAGVYAYGRTKSQKAALIDKSSQTVGNYRYLPPEEWQVFLPNTYPAYITWEQYLENCKRLSENCTHDPKNRGAIREGVALLQGIVICGVCGRRMNTHYSNRATPTYLCSYLSTNFAGKCCQSITGNSIDNAISNIFLQAVNPAQLDISLKTLEQIEQQAAQVERQWQQQLERACYEAERVRRQYDQTEPEHRLVVRTLEREWEQKLQEVETLKRKYETRPRLVGYDLNDQVREKILNLAKDLPRIWNCGTTTNKQHKQLLRLLIKDVTLKKVDSKIQIAIMWQTQLVTNIEIDRPRAISELRKNTSSLIEEVQKLAKKHTDPKIAQILKQQGTKSATGKEFNRNMVSWIRYNYDIPSVYQKKDIQKTCNGRYSSRATAQILNISITTVLVWCKKGKLDGKQGSGRKWWIHLTPEIIKKFGYLHRT